MDDSEFLRRLRPSHVAGGGNLYRHLDKMDRKGGDKLIYNIIVNTQPSPTGDWDTSLVVELEIDSNPEFKMFGQGVILRFDLEEDDWSIPAITDYVVSQIQADLEESTLAEAREISAPLHEGITEAYSKTITDHFDKIRPAGYSETAWRQALGVDELVTKLQSS